MLKKRIKDFTKPFIFKIIDAIPSIILSNVIFAFPSLIRIIGPNKEVITHRYLGSLTVRTNMKYRIERYMLKGVYEPESIAIFKKYICADNVCIDIGANVGALTLAMAQLVGKHGKVYSFEPGPRSFERLKYNVQLNKEYENIVQCVNEGISDRDETLFWEEEIHNLGNAVLKNVGTIKVPVTTIDKYFSNKNIEHIDFVKIDIEGMEIHALRGGNKTWKKYKPIFYFETLEPFRYRDLPDGKRLDIFYEIEKYFKLMNYSLYDISNINDIVKTNYLHLSNNTLALNDLTVKKF